MTRLGALTTAEVGDDRVLLLPLGSTEQHGPHLPLDTDTVIASVARTGRLLAVGEAFPWGGVTAEVVSGLSLVSKNALHRVLGGNPRVVGAGQPQRLFASHALEPDQHVLQGVVQSVA